MTREMISRVVALFIRNSKKCYSRCITVFLIVVAILVINFLGFYKTVRFSGSLWVIHLVKWVCFICFNGEGRWVLN